MKVNLISEADLINNFGHGIWAVYRQQAKGLQNSGVEIEKNRFLGSDCDVVHMHTYGPFAYMKANFTKKPLVISCHTLPKEVEGSAVFAQPLSMFFEVYLPSFFSKADIVITPSAFTKEQLEKFHVTRPIYVVSNGVDTKKFRFSAKKRKEFRAQYGIRDSDVVVYNVAEVIMRKGLDVFIEMSRRFPDVKFVWVGRQPLGVFSGSYSKLRYFVNTAPKNVIFTGFVDDIVAAHCAGDIFFSPTRFENECIALLEAASVSNPSVISNLPVFSQWMVEGKNCLKASELDEYEEKLNKMIKDRKFRKKLGAGAKKVAEKKDIRKVSKNLIAVYKIAMKQRNKKSAMDKASVIWMAPIFGISAMFVAFLYAKDKVRTRFISAKNQN
jgi:1,2-diacylglycerol-3-alpha-glucose alpha-1,2-glucosyltransferase